MWGRKTHEVKACYVLDFQKWYDVLSLSWRPIFVSFPYWLHLYLTLKVNMNRHKYKVIFIFNITELIKISR